MAQSHKRPDRYTLSELEEMTGINGRTIRYYITEGLLMPAYGRGPSATYDHDHLLRLQAIGRLKEQRKPLRDIRAELEQLTTDDLAMMINTHVQPEVAMWRHHQLHPDFVIQVREREQSDRQSTHELAFDLIIEYARSVLDDLDSGAN
ncbi:MAG: MerR family transcriptional regulator [Thermomicrobiales bacterium]|nr:MerR family transcriptional regulator [Thermomicrobiales bacterium]